MANTEVNWPTHQWQTGPHWWSYRDDNGVRRCRGCGISRDMEHSEEIVITVAYQYMESNGPLPEGWGKEGCAKCGGKFDLEVPFGDGWAVGGASGPLVHGRCGPW